jgi:hypothetical protein
MPHTNLSVSADAIGSSGCGAIFSPSEPDRVYCTAIELVKDEALATEGVIDFQKRIAQIETKEVF